MTDLERLTPDPDQEALIREILRTGLSSGGAVDGSQPGVGKTVTKVEVGLRMWADRVLIIAPGGTFDNWEATLKRQGGGQLRPCSNSKLGGHTAKVTKANLAAMLDGEPGWFFITREMFVSADWETVVKNGRKVRHQKRVYRDHPFDLAIYDEIQAASARKSNGHKTWMALQARLKVAQSADWFGNILENMHTVAWDLWPDLIEQNQYTWKDQWLTTEFDRYAWDKKRVTGEKIPGAFAASLPCYVRLDSPLGAAPEPEVRWVDLSPQQRKLYDKLESDMIAWVEDNPLVIELPMHLRIRLRQLTLGMFTVGPDGEVDFPTPVQSTKLDEALSIMKDHPGQFILGTDSQRFARAAVARIPGAVEWSGQVSKVDRDDIKARYLTGEIQHIVSVIPSMAEGIDGLQNASHRMIFLSESDNELINRQFIGRLHRRGQEHPVQVWTIKARGTYDLPQGQTLMQRALQNNMAKGLAVNGTGR